MGKAISCNELLEAVDHLSFPETPQDIMKFIFSGSHAPHGNLVPALRTEHRHEVSI